MTRAWLLAAGCLGALGCRQAEARDDASCTPCHAAIAAEHEASSHARSTGSPVFQALLPRAGEAWGEDAARRCVGCHAPARQPDGEAEPHVGCAHCHAAIGNAGERDGRLLVDLDKALAGPGRGGPAPHAVRGGGFLASSALCATCHEVTGPALFVEGTGAEHGAYAAAGGEDCKACHAPVVDGRARHGFVALSPGWGLEATARAARAAEAEALLARGLSLGASLDGSTLSISVSNVGAGHAVPTGVAFFRRVWVRVRVVDADGAVVFARGEVDEAGRVVSAPPLSLGAELRREGQIVWDPTAADEVVAGSLPPGEQRAAEVPLPACPGCAVEVSLVARAFAAETLEVLGLSDRADEVPTLVATTLSLALDP